MGGRIMRRAVTAAALLAVCWPAASAVAADGTPYVPDTLLAAARANRDASFNVIVQGIPGRRSARVADDVATEMQAEPGPGRAIGVRRRFASIGGVAAQLTGRQIVRLSRKSWVLAITVDAPLNSTAAQPPAATSVPWISGTPEVGRTLAALPGSWAGADPLALAYQWQRCG